MPLLRWPSLFLFLQMVFYALWFGAHHGWTLVTRTDTKMYLELAQNPSLVEHLSSIRTSGYPLFLWLVQNLGLGLSSIPLLHYLLSCGSVLVFYWGLKRFGARPWPAGLVSSPLIYNFMFYQEGTSAITDSMGLSLAVMSVGLLLASIKDGRWIGLMGLMGFVAAWVRPAYLALLPILPFLGLILTPRDRVRRAVLVGMAVALPFFSYFILRQAVVGQFSMVAFSGRSQFGVAGMLLTEDLIPHLDEKVQELARSILENRRSIVETLERGDPAQVEAMYNRITVPPEGRPDLAEASLCATPLNEDGTFLYSTWSACWGYHAHYLGRVAGGRHLLDHDRIELDKELGALSKSIFVNRPLVLVRWILIACSKGTLEFLAKDLTLRWILALLILCEGLLVTTRFLAPASLLPGEGKLAWDLTQLAVVFFGAKMLVITLAGRPDLRYVCGAGVFLPCALMAIVVWRWSRLPLPRFN